MKPFYVSTKSHLITILLGTWLVLGIFIDGYAHNHGAVETFFTPWHAILYSGFLTCAGWITILIVYAKKRHGGTWKQAIPQGYELGVMGIIIFLAGGLGDMAWHVIFGIEVSIEGLLSPSHLALMFGAILILSSPFRSGWREQGGDEPKWKTFFSIGLSLSLVISTIGFFLMYLWMFRYNLPAERVIDWYSNNSSPLFAHRMVEDAEVRGITFILLNTMLFIYPVLLLLKRWQPPVGAISFIFVLISLLMCVLDGFNQIHGILISLVAGIAADIIIYSCRSDLSRIRASRLVAIFTPIVLWGSYFGWMAATSHIGWEPELWTGSIVKASLLSLAISLLAFSPKRELI